MVVAAGIAESSEDEIAERGVTVKASAERPVEFAIALFDGSIVDVRDIPLHQVIPVEFPIFFAVAAEPSIARRRATHKRTEPQSDCH
jgi:hypothetical protein